jgi:pimeloyl-ACP methyl ester carboxylesterase
MSKARSYLITAVALLALSGTAVAEPRPDGATRNIVIVHGAFVDGSGWRAVHDILEKDGYRVTLVQEPLTGLADDVAATKRVLDLQDGPVVLVGHSYGGSVVSIAGADTALRLPAIRRLRIAATISSSVKSGCSAISASKKSACFSSGEMLPPLLGRDASSLVPALHPFDRRAGTHLEAFGRLAPRRARFHRFQHALAQVQRTRFRHRSTPKNRINIARLHHLKIAGNPRFNPAETCSS